MKREINFKFHVIQMRDQGVTVGYIPTETSEGIQVKVAHSWTNPKDTFNKARGREIVAGRLDANRENVFTLTIPNIKHPTKASEYRDLEARICDSVMDHMPKAVADSVERNEKKIQRLLAAW